MDVTMLQKQHRDILGQAGEIKKRLTEEQVKANAFDLSLKLGYLAGVIKMHLKSEDDYLYPTLAKSKDKAVVERATVFNQEMGGIASSFSQFREDFSTATKIKENPRQFISRFQEIFQALSTRIEKEEMQLYPLLK